MATVQTYKLGATNEPSFPNQFEVLKKSVLQVTDLKTNRNKYYVLELHHAEKSSFVKTSFRIFTHYGRTDDLEKNPRSGKRECRYCSDLSIADNLYHKIYRQITSRRKGYKEISLASTSLGSQQSHGQSCGKIDKKTLKKTTPTKQVQEKVSPKLHPKVNSLIHYLYSEATNTLTQRVQAKITAKGIETPLGILSIGQIEKGEEILQKLYSIFQYKHSRKQEQLQDLSSQFYTVIPHKLGRTRKAIEASTINTLKEFQQKQETLQLMKDMLKISFDTSLLHKHHNEQKYEALQCEIQVLSKRTKQYKELAREVIESQINTDNIKIENIYSIQRQGEDERFTEHIPNQQLLLHGSNIQNWVGILSRGILLPKLVQRLGGERTDDGWLGHGIYFSDTACSSSFYTSSGKRGTAFMALTQVALGRCKKFTQVTNGLTKAPKGYDSCHGVSGTEFFDDEYAIYDVSQQKLKYLVEFSQ